MRQKHKPEVLINAVNIQGLSYRDAARKYGVSKSLVHKLHQRWREEGDRAFQQRSTRPTTCPTQIPPRTRERVLALREQLTREGLDAGCDTLHTHMIREGHTISRTTIWRILKRHNQITPQPQKRPKSSFTRFEADQPNETWQSDITHWELPDGTVAHIIGWIDDHSRYMLHLSAHTRQTGDIVTTS